MFHALRYRTGLFTNPTLAGIALLAGLASMSSCGEVREGLHIISSHEDVSEGRWAPPAQAPAPSPATSRPAAPPAP